MCADKPARLEDGYLPIPRKEVDAFIKTLPRRLFLFPSHTSKTVRTITLKDVYRSVLRAVNFTLQFLNQNKDADEEDFLSLFVEFQTSLNPFLSKNKHIESAVASLATSVACRINDELSPDFDNLCVLCDLKHAIPVLPQEQQRKVRNILRKACNIVKQTEFEFTDNLIVRTFRENGHVPNDAAHREAWEQWLLQVVDVRYAKTLGMNVPVGEYYRKTLARIVELPFQERYLYELQNVATHASYGFSEFNRISRHGNGAMEMLATWGMAFFSWLDENCLHADDPETIGAFLDAFCKGPSHYYDGEPDIGTIFDKLLESQHRDGRWRSEDYRQSDWGTRAEYLYSQYHPTWVCVAAMRPARHDLANARNRALGLI